MKDRTDPDYYPEATCQTCSKVVDTTEEVDICMGEIELWCYCRSCDIETFHWIPKSKDYPNNKTYEEYERGDI